MSKKKVFRILFAVAVIALMGLVLTGCSSPGGGAEEKEASKGETIKIGEVKYTVTGVDKMKEVGKEGNIMKAKGNYVVVDLTIENIGKERAEFDGDMAKLWDEGEQAYDLDLEASAAACSASGIADTVNIWFGAIEPGETIKSRAVFDLSPEIKDLKIELRNPEIGSEERGFVKLGI